MHGMRWLTAVVALPVLILWILKGGPILFGLLILVASLVGLDEFHRLVDARSEFPANSEIRWVSRAMVPVFILAAWLGAPAFLFAIPAAIFAMTGYGVWRFGSKPELLLPMCWEMLGLLWIPVMLGFTVMLRNDVFGVQWVFLTLLIVASGDTGGYYGGRFFGGRFFGERKFAPHVSPKKTIEGYIGGVVASVVLAILFKFLFFSGIPALPILLVAFLTALIAPFGDLFESMQKRAAGIKDSGTLLPGHGGLLDRIDALLFAAPVVWILKTVLLGA